jgi:hypothetical protein
MSCVILSVLAKNLAPLALKKRQIASTLRMTIPKFTARICLSGLKGAWVVYNRCMAAEAIEERAETEAVEPRARARFRGAVHCAAGVLLIVAAGMKAAGLVLDAEASTSLVRLGQFALIQFELLLGGALLFNLRPRATWFVAIATFALFAIVSGQKAMAGAPSCGCFGAVTVAPGITAGIDVAMLVLLWVAGPRVGRREQIGPDRNRITRAGAIAIALLMLLGASVFVFAIVPKPGLVAEQADFDVGPVTPPLHGQFDHRFVLRNTSSRAIRIIGSETSCGCTAADYPHEAIAPGATALVHVHADWSDVVAGDPSTDVTLTTDSLLTRKVKLTLHGHFAGRT